MRKILPTLFLTLLLPELALAEDLFRREVTKPTPGGPGLEMSVEETRRDAKTSDVKVVFKSGSSVGSSFFVMGCICDLAVARNARYFVVLKNWSAEGKGSMVKVGFTDNRDIAVKDYFELGEAEPTDKRYDIIPSDPGTIMCALATGQTPRKVEGGGFDTGN